MIYAIEARESQYQGLHGIASHEVIEARTLEEACEFARERSMDIIQSYGLEPEPEEDEDWESDEECEQAWAEAIDYGVWRVLDTKGKSVNELDEEFCYDPDGFLEVYNCVAE